MDCPAALHRLVVGVPATVEHSAEAGNGDAGEMGKWVAETTQVRTGSSSLIHPISLIPLTPFPSQSFITFMDALKLNLRAKDQLHPFLSDLMAGYSRFKGSGEWEGRGKILGWLIELNKMKASEEITEEQSRQVGPASGFLHCRETWWTVMVG